MIVGLIGKKRSGKDSFAATLVAERAFTRFAFADPLKEAALALNPIVVPVGEPITVTPANADTFGLPRLADVVAERGWEAAKEIPEVRRTLQEFGVGIRAIQEDFWVRSTLDRAVRHGGNVVITDVRFPNEADEIRDAGGLLIRIHRPRLISDDQHPSEVALDRYAADLTVLNAGTLDDLAETARSLPLP